MVGSIIEVTRKGSREVKPVLLGIYIYTSTASERVEVEEEVKRA